jgi:hypothetical protein
METNSTAAQLERAPYGLGFDHGYLLVTPISTNPDYLDGWADGHDEYMDDKGVPA